MLEIPESKPTDTKLAEEPKIDINFIIKDYISKISLYLLIWN